MAPFDPKQTPSIDHDLFPVRTMVTLLNHHSHYLVSDLDAFCHAFAHLIDNAMPQAVFWTGAGFTVLTIATVFLSKERSL